MPKLGLCPGMSKTEYNLLMKNKSKVIQKIIFSRHIITILEELRHMVHHPEIKISGRLQLEQGDQQQRVITWRGVATIKSQFQVPTLLLDATLPDLKILRVLHPEAKIVADIHVDMPTGVKIRQILDTPTSSNKLINAKDPRKHREAVRRYILRRWFETNRQSMLVICQMEMQQWLEGKLPENISLGHYNAIAGLDEFRDVRVLILIGRTQPGPQSIETLSATLSGSMPSIVISQQSSFNWFRRVRRGVRMKDGTGVAVLGDKHPDEFCESVRQQITESELIQAIGRARGVNRNDETPLDIDLMFDTVLPASVDEVAYWEKPSLFYATAIDGVVLESPTDLIKVWPTIWANEKAAYRSIKDGIPKLPGFIQVEYQLEGPKMKTRVGRFDLTLIPNPRRWLEEHLGRHLPPLRKMSECS